MKKLVVLFLLGCSVGVAQKKPYIIVPKQFSFQKYENQHHVNGLVKHLFEGAGYETYWADDIPLEVAQKPCESLKVDVKDVSNIFTTKLFLNLLDCRGTVAFESPKAESKEKVFSKSFAEALRIAFEKIQEKILETEIIETLVEITENHLQITNELYFSTSGENIIVVNKQKETVFRLQKTSIPNVYNAVRSDGQQGLFFNKEKNEYHFEYRLNNHQIIEKYKVYIFTSN